MSCYEHSEFDHTCDDCMLPANHFDPGDLDPNGACVHREDGVNCPECGK